MYDFKTTGSGCFQINDWVLPKDQFLFQFRGDEMAIRLGYKYEWINFVKYDQYTNNGVPFASLEELKTFVADNCFKKKVVDGGYKGVATTETEPIMEGGANYRALMAGTYTNFKDSDGNALVVTSDDLAAGFVYLLGTDGVFEINVDATKEYVDQAIAGVNLDQVAINSGSTALNPYQLLVKTDAGTFEHRNWNQSVIAGAFAVRTTSGDLNLPLTPNNDASATSKKYVDQNVAGVNFTQLAKNSGIPNVYSSALIGTNPSNVVGLLYYSDDLSTTGRLVKRTSDNRVKAAAPRESDDCVNLQSFNLGTNSKPEILALSKISDPSTATTEDVVTLLNSLIDALKA